MTLTFNFKVTGGLLKVRFWLFFHILAQFSYTQSCIILWLVYRVGVKSFEDLDLKDLNPFYKGFEILLPNKTTAVV